MPTETMNIKIERVTKDSASEIAQAYGFDLSSVLWAVCAQIARTRILPVLTSYDEAPAKETAEAMAWGDAFLSEGRQTRFSSADEMFAAIEKDEYKQD